MKREVPAHFIDVFEAAARAGVTHETIRIRIKAGDLTEYRVTNRALRVDPAELAAIQWGKGRTFWEKVSKSEGCWLWTGRTVKGYGKHSGKLAHRVAYEEMVGPIPDGLELDHLCRTPLCVRPDHLEPVTRHVNMRRRFDLKTHCVNGHEFTSENTYLRDGYYRTCRTCTVAAQHRYQARKRAG